jgi:putative endonuclease
MSTTDIGKKAEEIASDFLRGKGYHILQRNYRNRFCEIDIVAVDKNQLVFAEVKYRKNSDYGEPLQSITKQKFKRMARAIDFFLSEKPEHQYLSPRLDVIGISGDLDDAQVEHLPNCFWS